MPDANTHTRGRGRGRGGSARGRGGSSSRGAESSSSSQAIPSGSVSKIKAQLRQTKRLLAKEDLNPDVRVTSERRLEALQDELVKAEKGLLEKKMVTKYRGIKFFERQKVLRRIKQAKKQVEQGDASDAIKEQLKLARMDLYYILRYPKTEKYLALYPENSYIPYSSTPPSSTTSGSSITPSDPSKSSLTKTKAAESEQKRWELRREIVRKVETGEWTEESEVGDLGIEGEEDVEIGIAPVASKVGEKRNRRDEADEDEAETVEVRPDDVEEDSSTPAKKRKVEDDVATVAESTAGEAQAEGETGAEAEQDGEPKKLNRKQKKALRRAQEAAGEVPPAAATAPTPTLAKKVGEANPSGGRGAGAKQKESTKKKEAVVPAAKASKAEKLAMEDDFFA